MLISSFAVVKNGVQANFLEEHPFGWLDTMKSLPVIKVFYDDVAGKSNSTQTGVKLGLLSKMFVQIENDAIEKSKHFIPPEDIILLDSKPPTKTETYMSVFRQFFWN